MDAEPFYLKISEVARLLRCSPESVRRWISRGQLAAVRDKHTGRYLVPRQAVLDRLQAVGQPAPPRPVALVPIDSRTRATLARFGITLPDD